jgi:hypothetical protein
MFLAIILIALTPWLGNSASALSSQDSQASQAAQQTSNPPNSGTPQETEATKPCPASSDSSSAKPADCKSARSKRKKHQHAQTVESSATGPTKTVIRNGSTPDPTVAISPDLSNQETSRELDNTNRLLVSADANLKQIASRQLSTAQEDTVKQIKVYMEQARLAAKNGEVQRAYTLANKANMLSADLAAPRQ